MKESPATSKKTESESHSVDTYRAPKCGKWARRLCLGPLLLPIVVFAITELFDIGSLGLAVGCIIFLLFVSIPCCLASFILGVIGLVRKEYPIQPAVTSVAFSSGPVLFGLWVLGNYLTMGEPW